MKKETLTKVWRRVNALLKGRESQGNPKPHSKIHLSLVINGLR